MYRHDIPLIWRSMRSRHISCFKEPTWSSCRCWLFWVKREVEPPFLVSDFTHALMSWHARCRSQFVYNYAAHSLEYFSNSDITEKGDYILVSNTQLIRNLKPLSSIRIALEKVGNSTKDRDSRLLSLI